MSPTDGRTDLLGKVLEMLAHLKNFVTSCLCFTRVAPMKISLSVKANRKNPISILQYDINLSTMKAAALHMKSWLATVASAQECNVSSARVALACA